MYISGYNPPMVEIPDFGVAVLDTDGFAADTTETAIIETKKLIIRYNSKNPKINFTKDDVNDWKFVENKLVENGFSQEDANRFGVIIWNNKRVLRDAKPIPGVQELVQYLKSKDKVIASVTSRPSVNGIKELTQDWILDNLVIQDVFVNPDTSNHNGPEHKASVAIELGEKYDAGVLICDDYPGHVIRMINFVKEYIKRTGKDIKVHFVLSPYAKIEVPDELMDHPMVTVVRRDSQGSLRPIINRLKYSSVAQS